MTRATCIFEGCDLASYSGPRCPGHDSQKRRGIALRPLRRKMRSDIRNEDGQKMCTWCDEWKNDTEFYKRKGQRDGLSPWCKECDNVYVTCRKFNITREFYLEMLAAQGGVCAICGGTSPGQRLSVDHDHACCDRPGSSCGKCVRGLLCSDCNRAIGMMCDDPARLRSAATYLERG
jgi:hypothetical protein